MRLAYFEAQLAPDAIEEADALWLRLTEWQQQAQPRVGRIDIRAIGWIIESDPSSEQVTYRVGVPVRSDYTAPSPARTTLFPGGAFAYCHADDVDDMDEAFSAVRWAMDERDYVPRSGPIEAYLYHFNVDQHPVECGFLVGRADGGEVLETRGHEGPLPIGR
jgi:hypothetical protein